MKTYKVICDKCGYQEEFNLNSEGYYNQELFYNPPSSPLGEIWEDFILDEEILAKIDDLIVNKNALINLDSIEHRLYYSSKEEKVYCLLYFCLFYADKKGNMKKYIPRYKDENGNNLELLKSKNVVVKCPNCGNKINGI